MNLDSFLDDLRSRRIFEPGTRLIVTRAPGRLDVMGGIADYSGSLVLQKPIAEATFVALQRIESPVLEIMSAGRPPFTMRLDALAPDGTPVSYDTARRWLPYENDHHWAAYVAGLFLVLMRERQQMFSSGARIAVGSTVPEGKGVSSSAALETAAMQAVIRAYDIPLDPTDLALCCQQAENLVAGAPCGLMDQMTCVFGREDALLALLCQPASLQSPVTVPEDIAFWGIDSGERHAVGGSDYTSVRTGAFMGRRIVYERLGAPEDYLVNLTPAVFDREFRDSLPIEMSGAAFLARYAGTSDTVTSVEPDRLYRIRQPTAHPIYEHHRVTMFRELLSAPASEERRVRLGELMYQSHAGYSACGLGSRGTDLLVDLIRAEGPAHGVYGGRITGGGSGGTVAVVARRDATTAIARIAAAYGRASGFPPYVFSGSSPGVTSFGARVVSM